ncbi:unnamed protein product [Prunus armeniaca]|uniref:Uncharacterized protein n=1 Tax=Prunus armeniaca TaxID=36596 RepID=A0A6J5UNI9_PRUAR|nr:unnamed protein product [Prunus armeniaca]
MINFVKMIFRTNSKTSTGMGEKQQHTQENNQGTKDQALARGQLARPTTCQAVLDMDDEAEEYSF